MLLYLDMYIYVCICTNTNCGAASMLVKASWPAQVQSVRPVPQRRTMNTLYIMCTYSALYYTGLQAVHDVTQELRGGPFKAVNKVLTRRIATVNATTRHSWTAALCLVACRTAQRDNRLTGVALRMASTFQLGMSSGGTASGGVQINQPALHVAAWHWAKCVWKGKIDSCNS
jgi:hypothetical protein